MSSASAVSPRRSSHERDLRSLLAKRMRPMAAMRSLATASTSSSPPRTAAGAVTAWAGRRKGSSTRTGRPRPRRRLRRASPRRSSRQADPVERRRAPARGAARYGRRPPGVRHPQADDRDDHRGERERPGGLLRRDGEQSDPGGAGRARRRRADAAAFNRRARDRRDQDARDELRHPVPGLRPATIPPTRVQRRRLHPRAGRGRASLRDRAGAARRVAAASGSPSRRARGRRSRSSPPSGCTGATRRLAPARATRKRSRTTACTGRWRCTCSRRSRASDSTRSPCRT
jgi:hypothetical protein